MSKFKASSIVVIGLIILFGCSWVFRFQKADLGPPRPRLSSDALNMVTQSSAFLAEQRQVNKAVVTLENSCLAKLGIPVNGGDVRVDKEQPFSPNRDPNSELAAREKVGYGIWRSTKSDVKGDRPRKTDTGDQVSRMEDALVGSAAPLKIKMPNGLEVSYHPDGCEANARRDLANGKLEDFMTAQYAPQAYYSSLSAIAGKSPAFGAAMSKWQVCMAKKRFPYESPDDAYAAMQNGIDKHGPTKYWQKLEIKVAVADTQCAMAARLYQVMTGARINAAARLSLSDMKNANELAQLCQEIGKRATLTIAGQ